MAEFQLRATGPDRYCPDCGRWLVKVKDDGTFDLAGESEIQQQAVVRFNEELTEVDALVIEAVCLRCHPEEEEGPKDWQAFDRIAAHALRHRLPKWLGGKRD